MAGDFSKPVNTDAYATLLQFIRENIAELAKGLDASKAANIPSGAIRFNSTTKRWEKWNGSAWSELVAKASASYDIRTAQADDVVVGASTAKAQGQVGPAASSGGVSNANSYLASGSWFVASADATTNWPEAGVGGVLKVDANSTVNYIRQTFFIYNANRVYSRYSANSGSAWSAWKHVTADADWNAASGADGFIANKPTLGTAAALNIQSDRYDGSQGIPAMCGAFGFGLTAGVYSGNLNDITKTSIYYCDSNTLNRPININGWVETLVYDTTGYAVQRYYPNGYTGHFVRSQTGGTWGAWASPGGDGFLVAKTANQTLAAGTITRVTFDSEIIDDHGAFASNVFTVKNPGRYIFGAHVHITSGTESQSVYAYLYKNGTIIGYNYIKLYGSAVILPVTILRECAIGDIIECKIQVGTAGEVNTAATKFWGARL